MVCLLLLGVTIVLSWAAYLQVRNSVIQLAEQHLERVADELSNLMAASGRQLHGRARVLAANPAIRGYL